MIPYDNKYRKSHRVLGGDYGYSFTDEEKEVIRDRLHTVAKKCFQRYGIRKTAVDRMAVMTDISKGSFYNFYSSREMIFTALTLPEELLIESLHTEKT